MAYRVHNHIVDVAGSPTHTSSRRLPTCTSHSGEAVMVEREEKWTPAGRCSLVAADIVGFGEQHRNRQVQTYLRDSLYKLIGDALQKSGVELDACYSEDRGDGFVIAVRPDIPTERLIHPFVEYVRAGLRLHNMVSSDLAQMRLRVALHGTEAWTDTHGLVGDGVIHLFRLLDASEFKQLVRRSGAYLAMIASEAIYDGIIRHAPDLIDPDDYVGITVENKEMSGTGWVRLVGRTNSVSQPA